MTERIENQEITRTIHVQGLLSGADVGTWQADYPLTALDFEHIKNGKPVTFNWANSILLTTIGFGMSIAAKYFTQLAGVQQQIYPGEWRALFGGIIVSVALYVLGLALPNDRKTVMRKIQNHFKTAPRKRQLVKGEQS